MELVLEQRQPFVPAVELVERKGLGHPDTICDALSERLSQGLSRLYLERFGVILHHNVDKALLRGGRARAAFGGGEVLAPIEVFLCGRAFTEVEGVALPVEALVIDGSRAWLREHLHALDVERDVAVRSLLRQGSADLVGLFARGPSAPRPFANDTSFGVGFAPRSALERVVLATSARLEALAKTSPEVGEDTKVMGVRRGEAMHLTVACAFVGRHLPNLAAYVERKSVLARELAATASEAAGAPVTVAVNAADDLARGSVYLTVTGTSAECGDDGQVGRGNRVNGLITPGRPMSLEAAAGKNPVSHVGKLYNVLADELAAALVREVPGVTGADVRLVSCIGRPIDEPQVVHVELALADGSVEAVRPRVEGVVRARLGALGALTERLVRGQRPVF